MYVNHYLKCILFHICQHTTREITRIAEFLEVNYTEELILEIAEKVDFKNFFKGKPDVTGKFSKDGKPFIYRKGNI